MDKYKGTVHEEKPEFRYLDPEVAKSILLYQLPELEERLKKLEDARKVSPEIMKLQIDI